LESSPWRRLGAAEESGVEEAKRQWQGVPIIWEINFAAFKLSLYDPDLPGPLCLFSLSEMSFFSFKINVGLLDWLLGHDLATWPSFLQRLHRQPKRQSSPVWSFAKHLKQDFFKLMMQLSIT
jgi:hypothetical protein